MRVRTIALAAALVLGACSKSPSENTADQLENAADQSTPAAADVLDNAADAVRENGQAGNAADPNGAVQNALEDAANAEAPAAS